MDSLFARAVRLVAALCVIVAVPSQAFEASPTRQVGPPGAERTIGASINGQGGWSVPSFDNQFDQGISTAQARSGSQSWRVSNWYSSGVVDAVRSPAFAPALEGSGNSTAFQDFWFYVPAGNEGLLVSTSLSDTGGRRMTYAEIRVAGGVPQVMAVGVALGDNGSNGCSEPRPLLCDAGIDYVSHTSVGLATDAWYRLRVDLSLNAGENDDVVDYRVFDAGGALVWQALGVPSWEDMYWDSIYGSGQKVTVELMQVRLAEDPDAAPGFESRNFQSYAAGNQPLGLFIDDLAIGSGAGAAQVTSFESPNGSGGLTRYVDDGGNDAGNDCTNQALPCATLQHAIAEAVAGDAIEIAYGTYLGPFLIDKTLHLRRGAGGLQPELKIQSGPEGQTLLTVADATDVSIEGLAFDIDQSYVSEGITTQGTISGLSIVGNSFIARQSVPGVQGQFGRRHAVAINLNRDDTTLHGGAANIEFSNNVCTGTASPPSQPAYFRACLAADAIGGTISGNLLTGGYYDAIVRFSTSPVAITGNTFSGGGLQLTENNANGHTSVQGNIFDPDETRYPTVDGGGNPVFFGSPALGPVSILLKLQNPSGSGNPQLDIVENTFRDHVFAILAQNVAGMQLSGNSFTPRAGHPDFLHLALSNKVLSSNSPALAPRALSIAAAGNTFDGEAGVTRGTAVAFWNHHASFGGDPAPYGSLVFSGNSFSGDLEQYFALDPTTCASSASCGLSPFALMAGTAGIPGTPVAPFAGSLSALGNSFDGVLLEAGSTLGERAAVELKVFHRADDPALGLVDLGFGTESVVYVDDDFAGASLGEARSFDHVAGGFSGLPVYAGINAFDSIGAAIAQVQEGGTVFVARGNYPDVVVVDRFVHLLGDGNADLDPANSTVIENLLQVGASGLDAGNPLRIANLRVRNVGAAGDGDGIRLVGSTSHVRIEDVVSSGNAGNGMKVFTQDGTAPSLTTGLAIVGSSFDDNGTPVPTTVGELRAGLMFDEEASVDGLVIEGSSFSGNNAAGLTFNDIGSPTSTATVNGVTISNSVFNRNNPGDSGIAGGGVWLKTGAAGSAIQNVTITGSQFFDNGTGQTNNLPLLPPRRINANGISVRVRPGTTLSGVSICGNAFGDTIDGSEQLVGIYVFDDTGNTGYQPVEVCNDNSFTALEASVSGYEQRGARRSQPVIHFSGGIPPLAEFVNTPVVRDRDDAEFPTILSALEDAETGENETILVPAGFWPENVVIAKQGTTLSGPYAATRAQERDGSGEAVISPASGRSVLVHADGATVAGFTIQGVADTAIGSGQNFGGIANDVAILNNRILDVTAGSGMYTNGEVRVADWTVRGNVVRDVTDPIGSGINLWMVDGALIEDNLIEDAAWGGIQSVRSSGVIVTRNTIRRTGNNGINLAQSTGSTVSHNLVEDANTSETEEVAGISLFGGSADIDVFCNRVSGTGHNSLSTISVPGFDAPISGLRVFHNGFLVADSVEHALDQPLAIGPNYYGGEEPTAHGGQAAQVDFAAALDADPFGGPDCGDLDPDALELVSGDAQEAVIETAFAPLVVRVLDVLGGPVAGVEVSFVAPDSGASAVLSAATVETDIHGIASVDATANGLSGAYSVTAEAGGLDVVFHLENTPAPVLITLDSPSFTYAPGVSRQVMVVTDPLERVVDVEVTYTRQSDGTVFGPCAANAADCGPVDAGIYDADAAIVGNPNYTGSASSTLTITRASGTVAWGPLVFDYDGTAHAVTATVAEDGTACAVDPASVGPEVGTTAVTATCDSPNYDVPVSQQTASVGGGMAVHVFETGLFYPTVAAALADPATEDGFTLELAPGTYPAPIVLTKGVRLQGGGISGIPSGMAAKAGTTTVPTTIVDGGGVAPQGVVVATDVQLATVTGLEVRNIAGHCVEVLHGAWGATIHDNLVHHCTGRGISVAGGGTMLHPDIRNVTISNNEVHDAGDRGIVVWDGLKQDITIVDNHVHDLSGCCGIELQDGAATGALVTGNVVENTGDSGMAFIQLTSGSPSSRPNRIAFNEVRNTGRFGIEIKIPNGTGLEDGDGAIIVEGNEIDGGGALSLRDRAGIAVHRRAYNPGTYPIEVDVTAGVVLRDNIVTGFRVNGTGHEGFGIVVEGAGTTVSGNVVTDSDVPMQFQQANPDGVPPGDSNQDALSDWFSRGNALRTCVIDLGNAIGGPVRVVPAGNPLLGSIRNQATGEWFCDFNAAIAAASPGDVLQAYRGEYRENVVVDKSVVLRGPHAGVHGDGAARGTGEATIIPVDTTVPASFGIPLRINADGVVVDGFEFADASGTRIVDSSNDDDVEFVNNRLLDWQPLAGGATGAMIIGPASGWNISRNLFQDFSNGTGSRFAMGVRLDGVSGALVSENTFRRVQSVAMQLADTDGSQVLANTVDGGGVTTNAGVQVLTSAGVLVSGNTVSGATHGLLVHNGNSSVTLRCNLVTDSSNGISFQNLGDGSPGGVAVLHNELSGTVADVANSASFPVSPAPVVGSNWYGPAGDDLQASGALQLADPLDVAPFGHPDCGDNTAVSIVAASGTPQQAGIQQPFAQPLVARVLDVLGGAVAGETLAFTAPAAGASAVLSPPSGTDQVSDFNGAVAAMAEANAFAGIYSVTAAGAAGSAEFVLENLALQQLSLDLNGPVGGVEVGDTVAYTGTIANDNPAIAENVRVRVVVGHDSGALDASDLAMCVVNPLDPGQCVDIAFDDQGATLGFDFPDAIGLPGGFDVTSPLPYLWVHQLRSVYGKAGVFTATAEVVGVVSGTVYAMDAIATEVIDQHAGVALELDGPVAGVEKDVATAYQARLTNVADDVADPVRVEFTVTRDGGIQAGDLTIEYDTGGGNYAVLGLADQGGMLVGHFGPAAGFPLPSGYDATTDLRVTYHVAPHTFTVAATVVDAVADSDGVPVYAAANHATAVIEAAADVAIGLDGPFDPSDGTTLVAPRVGESALLRGSLVNSGGPIPDAVRASFTIGTSFDAVEADDLLASYWFVAPGAACGMPAPEERETVSFAVAGGALVASTTPQMVAEGMAFDVCFELGFSRAGLYNIAVVIEDAAGDTDGVASYAADNLAFAVGKASAVVTIDGAVGGIVERAFTDAPQVVTASTTAPISGSIEISYAGSATAPSAPGTYPLLATIVDADYEGVASGTLLIGDGADVSLALAPVDAMAFVDEGTGYTGFVDFAATVGNAGAMTPQPVHTRITVVRIDDGNGTGGMPVAITEDDVKVCVYDVEGYQNQEPDHQGCPVDFQYLFSTETTRDGRPAVQFRYPNLPANDLPLATLPPTATPPSNLRFRAGEYRTVVEIVGSVDGTVYASATTNTTSVPDASISYSGPLSGPAEQLLISQTRLRNQGGRSTANVIVRITLSDAGGADLTAADAELFYQLGGAYQPLPVVEDGDGNLVTLYGPGAGFPLEDGHDATDAGAALFHRTGNYVLQYEVLDVATLGNLFASETVDFTIDPNAVVFTLGDLLQAYDGFEHQAAVSAAPAHATYDVAYAPFDGSDCGAPLAGLPVDAGSYCVTVQATGSFSGGASGVLVIQPAEATVTLDPASLSAVFDGGPHAAIATTVPAGLPLAFSYDGSSEPPVAVGSYTVIATVTDPNYTGGTSGVLTIAPADAALSLAGDTTGAVAVSGGPLYSLSSGTVSLSGPAPLENVRAQVSIARPGGITPDDLAVEYLAQSQESASCVADGAFWWCPLPLSDNGDGTVGAFFGTAAGFPLVDGAASQFRTQYYRGGQFHSTVRLVGVDSGQTWAIGAGTVDVAELTLLQTGPATALTNAPMDTSSTLRNIGAAAIAEGSGGPTDENVVGRFVVSFDGGALAPGDLDLQYLAPDGSYQPIGLTACGDALCGSFGPGAGFPVDAGYVATSLFRTVFSRAGGYLVETTVEGVESDVVYAEASQAFVVSSGTATVSIEPASLQATYDGTPHEVVVSTEPPGLAVEVSYDGSAEAPVDAGSYAVVATIVDPDYSGSVAATLVIAPKPVSIALADLGPYVYDGQPHPASASVIGLVGADVVELVLTYDLGATPPVDAGTYVVSASFAEAQQNYVAAPAIGLLAIAKAPAGVSFGALGPFTYDGLPKPVAALNPNNVALSLSYVGVEGTSYGPTALPPTNVGSYQATATIADPNYVQDPVTSGTFLVEPAGVTVAFGNLAQVYDGTPKLVSVTTVPAGVAVDVAYAQGGSPATPVNAGDYEVTATITDPNYVLDGPGTATLSIAKASAQVLLSDLVQIHDGTPRPVTVTTVPAGLMVEVSYDGAGMAPSAVGSYAVVATVAAAEPNHVGSASGTLTILAAAIAGFEVDGAVAFSGIAGAPLDGDLPTVRVLDTNGDGVAGVSVVFQQQAGGSSGATAGTPETVTTGADGRATVGSWVLPANAGDTVMTAEVSGQPGLPTVSFTATGEEVADVTVLKVATQEQVMQGGLVDYTITVGNAGPSNAQVVELADVLPEALDAGTAMWVCTAAGAASCNGDDAGTGDVAATLTVPVGDSVTVLLTAAVRTEAALGPFDNEAGVLLDSGDDPAVGNNTSTATVTVTLRTSAIFADGFEGDDGGAGPD